jgi:hypothetical protein
MGRGRTLAVVVGLTVAVAFLACGWILYPLAALDGPLSLMLLPLEDTHYTPGYSHAGFRRVHPGMTRAQVVRIIGPPLSVVWQYDRPVGDLPAGTLVRFGADGRVTSVSTGEAFSGWPLVDVERVAGPPSFIHLGYSRREVDTDYRIREVTLRGDRVVRVRAEMYRD